MDRIDYDSDKGLKVGALCTISLWRTAPIIKGKYPALAEAAHFLGSPQVRNLATIGGNLCNAALSAETASPLLALSATARLVSVEGEENIPSGVLFYRPRGNCAEK